MAMNPTYYGPAPVYGAAADHQTQGALSCAVQLDSRMELRNDGPHLYEKFKTNTRAVLSTGGRGFNIHGAAFLPDNARPDIASNPEFVTRFPVPTTDPGFVWIVEEVNVEQQEAGDHSIVTVTSRSVDWQEGIPLSSGQIQVLRDRWDVEFRPVSMSVLAYCKNDNAPPTWVKYLPNVNRDILKPGGQASTFANARYIKECAAGSKYNQKWGQLGAYEWVRNQSIYKLNDKEKKIFNYYVNGINPELHVPVITHTTVKKYARNPNDAWIEGGHVKHIPDGQTIQYIDEVITDDQLHLANCPYTFGDVKFYWLKTGCKVTEHVETGSTTYVHVEEFTGARKWCGDFYKGGTWSINGNPPVNPWRIGEE